MDSDTANSTDPRRPAATFPVATIRPRSYLAPVILTINVLWFAAGWVLAWQAGAGTAYAKGFAQPGAVQTLWRIGAISAPDLLRGDWWRLLTNCFVHIGLLHLLVNMLMLATLGTVSERLWGWKRFAVIYLGSGLAGSALAMALRPLANGGTSILAGASGALWGVMLSVVVWYLCYRRQLPASMAREWRRKLGLALLFNLLISFAPGISSEAHIAGGLAGGALAFWLDRTRHPHRGITVLGLAGSLALLLFGLWSAVGHSAAWKALREPPSVEREIEPPPEPPPRPLTERESVIAAMAEFNTRLAPLRFGKSIDRLKTTDYILGKNSPKTVEDVRAILGDVGAARELLEPFHGAFADRFRDYLDRVDEVANAIRAWQGQPPRSSLDGIVASQLAAVAAWKKLNEP